MKNYILYFRVSTERQGKSKLGLEAQRKISKDYVKNNVVLKEFVEVESGKNDFRPQLAEAIELSRKLDAILLIAKLDRLSRNVSFIFNLRDSGVNFECCDIPEANTLSIGIFSTMAQHERELISQRTKAALAAKKARGEKMGSPQNLTDAARKKSIEARRTQAKNNPANKMAAALALELKGTISFRSIAKRLNESGFKTPRGNDWKEKSVWNLISKI
ncbi:MAG: recombinase family protein [Prevotellaceae bacterium]|jgi:DNA invertase Pin-like site-specific DNA recombinase|nr:recombinase family protein [Prevotellaceae bacterium]